MKRFILNTSIALALGLGLALALLWVLGGGATPVTAAPASRPLQGPGDVYCVAPVSQTYAGCTRVFTSVQFAVDAATGGEIIKVAAGTYTDIHQHGSYTQVVYIDVSVTIRGGYTTTNSFADPPDHETYPATLDAGGQGNVVRIAGDYTPTLEGLRLTNGSTSGDGGGIYVINAHPIISGCQIFGNTAGYYGGGVHLHGSDNAILAGNEVYSNTASNGGGVFLYSGDNTVLTGNDVYSNTANYGGGVYVNYGIATLSGGQIISNTANIGGGMYIEWGSVTLAGGQIVSNTASQYGGGVYIGQTTAAFTQTGAGAIAHNVASGTGLLDGGGGVYVLDGSATLEGGQILSNTASNDGGGVYVYQGSATLEEGQIVGNKANDVGGGAFVRDSSASLNVSRGQIVGNTARGGGGVYNRSGTLSLVNTTVSRNTASSLAGGGLWNQNSSAASVLTFTTVASNTAASGGGGINRASGTVLLQNTIVAYNGTANCSGGVTSNGHNLEYGDACNLTATGDITDTDPLLGPLTYDRGTWVHPLLEGSPAIDAGLCVAGITTDQRGMPRLDSCDIGAYERVLQVYLPLALRNY